MSNDGLPEGWARVRLADVVETVPSVKPDSAPHREFGYVDISSVCNQTHEILDHKRFKGKDAPSRARRPIRPGDVLFSNVRTYLRNIAIVPSSLEAQLCSTGFTVLRSNGLIDPQFLFRYVLTDDFIDRVTPQQTGTHYPATSDRVVLRELVRLPPLAEQQRIVAKVEALLARVNAARQRLAKVPTILKRFRQSVLAAACSGRLTADWREKQEELKPATDTLDRIRAERRRLWVDGIRQKGGNPQTAKYPVIEAPNPEYQLEIPGTWAVASMDEVTCLITSGSRDWKQYYREDGPGTFIMAQNVRPLCFDRSYRLAVNPPQDDRDRVRSQVREGDILVTIVGANTGDVCRISEPINQHYVCQSVALMRPVLKCTSPFLELFLNSPEHGQEQYRQWIYGEGRPHLSFDHLRATALAIPPLPEQDEIVRRVEALFRLADAIEKRGAAATARAEKLTQAILAKAFRGELMPTEAEVARQEGRDYEPASVLLERIRSEHAKQSDGKKPGKPSSRRRKMTN
jgi:type I restriction enzyme S subunit